MSRRTLGLGAAALLLAGCYGAVTISPASLPETVVGQTYSAVLTAQASDGTEIVDMYVLDRLPPGLTFKFERGVGGTISGAATATGTYTFRVSADGPHFNFGGAHGERAYTIVVH